MMASVGFSTICLTFLISLAASIPDPVFEMGPSYKQGYCASLFCELKHDRVTPYNITRMEIIRTVYKRMGKEVHQIMSLSASGPHRNAFSKGMKIRVVNRDSFAVIIYLKGDDCQAAYDCGVELVDVKGNKLRRGASVRPSTPNNEKKFFRDPLLLKVYYIARYLRDGLYDMHKKITGLENKLLHRHEEAEIKLKKISHAVFRLGGHLSSIAISGFTKTYEKLAHLETKLAAIASGSAQQKPLNTSKAGKDHEKVNNLTSVDSGPSQQKALNTSKAGKDHEKVNNLTSVDSGPSQQKALNTSETGNDDQKVNAVLEANKRNEDSPLDLVDFPLLG
ncbi:hypothetical protein ElyMa_004552300 [Elysia marginata]|uniref:Uncharacterized protein n=1 Tax=Elysia marginata TaxID=1093978 RepID=A0AAV4HQZ8_9GAST|nr:hypothetical protein ElyMa_004552300 [Elysia marginata]